MLWRLTFQLIPLAALGAAVVFGVLPLRLPRRWLWLSVAVLALAFSKFAVFAVVGGDAFTPMPIRKQITTMPATVANSGIAMS